MKHAILLYILLLFSAPSILFAQRPNGEAPYKIPPALAGNQGKIFVGTQRGTILYAQVQGSNVVIVDSAVAGGKLPVGVEGIWALSMPDRVNAPRLVVGLVSYVGPGTIVYGILRSTDLGDTWQLIKPQFLTDGRFPVLREYFTKRLSEFTWLDANNGWIYGNGGIIATTDGGVTWSEKMVNSDPSSTTGQPKQVRSLAFQDASNGTAVTGWWPSEYFAETSDGGASWTARSAPLGLNRALELNWIGGEYRALGMNRAARNRWETGSPTTYVYFSTNEGFSWEPRTINAVLREQTYMTELLWMNPDVGFMILRSGELWQSGDGGRSWTQIQVPDSTNYKTPMTLASAFGQNSIILDNERIVHVSTVSDNGAIFKLLQWPISPSSVRDERRLLVDRLSLYPNPASSVVDLRFRLEQSGSVSATVVDLLGRTVRSVDLGWIDGGEGHARLDLSDLPAGSYTVVVGGTATRIVKI